LTIPYISARLPTTNRVDHETSNAVSVNCSTNFAGCVGGVGDLSYLALALELADNIVRDCIWACDLAQDGFDADGIQTALTRFGTTDCVGRDITYQENEK